MSRKAKVTDAGEGLTLVLDCFGLLWLFPRNDAKLVVSPDNPNTFTPAVIARRVSAVAIHFYLVIVGLKSDLFTFSFRWERSRFSHPTPTDNPNTFTPAVIQRASA